MTSVAYAYSITSRLRLGPRSIQIKTRILSSFPIHRSPKLVEYFVFVCGVTNGSGIRVDGVCRGTHPGEYRQIRQRASMKRRTAADLEPLWLGQG